MAFPLPRFQRVVQACSLTLFLLLLWQAAWPFAGWLVQRLHPDIFLRLDPAGMLGSALAARQWLAGSLGFLLALAATACIGRFFCGLLCPFGCSVDIADRLLLGARRRSRVSPDTPTGARLRRLKYGLLCFLLLAAALGVSFVFFLAPIPLVTRLYGLLLQPMLLAVADAGLAAARPVLDVVGWSSLYYTQVAVPRFAQQLFVLGYFALVFGLALLSPRFWCRNLCPAGALFALCSRRPLLRRRVDESCVDCGRCQRECPMGAIPEEPRQTRFAECIICQRCVEICPVKAISFSTGAPAQIAPTPAFAASRRLFLWSGAAGMGGALLAMTELHSPYVPQGTGGVAPKDVVRPPGALPEPEFLARCVRCGECMKACPTNTLQPIGLGFGISGLFSPSLTPRRGPCEPTCRACGLVCPSGALRPMPTLQEKISAKLGTARVLPWKCLAWEHQRKCLVCDEVCPFDAIELVRDPGNPAPVPVVHESRCAGCGFCEYHCPVREERAIVVEPMGALRLAKGSYADAARAEGLQLSLSGHAKDDAPGAVQGYGQGSGQGYDAPQQGLPPGFEEAPGGDTGGNLPPGFEQAPQKSTGQRFSQQPGARQSQGGLPPGFEEPPQ